MNDIILVNMQFVLNIAFLWIGATVLFKGRITRIGWGILCYAIFLSSASWGNMPIDIVTVLMSVFSIICYMLTIAFAPEDGKGKKICVLFVLLYLQELFVMVLGDVLFFYGEQMSEQQWNTLNTLWSLCIIIVIAFLYSKNKNFIHGEKFIGFIRKSMIPLLILVAFVVVVMALSFHVFSEKSDNMRHYLIGSILSTLSMVSIGIIVIMVIYIKRLNEKMEQMLVLEQQMKQLQADYYETLLDKEVETRRYRHDVNNHLICLSGLIEDGDITGTKEYIKAMSTNMQDINRKSYCTGIIIIDVLLNYYVKQLETYVAVKVKGYCEQPVTISDIDMCVIFSNLLQNAVEAIKQSYMADAFLCIEVKQGKEFMKIRITNSFLAGSVQTDEKGNLQTVKKDKQNHGIGISNVKETVYKNGGKIDYQIEQQQMVCEVILPI